MTTSTRRAAARATSLALALAMTTALLVLAPGAVATAQTDGAQTDGDQTDGDQTVGAQVDAARTNYENVGRVDADSFVDAALQISAATYAPATTDTVVVATDFNFPDGLTASAVAATVGGPVLFTGPNRIGDPTLAEIDRLLDEDDTVIIMGGENAISAAVSEQIADAGFTPSRVSGTTRIETAAAAGELVGVEPDGRVLIARAFGPDGANSQSDLTTGWVDAISCGAYAAAEGLPILLTQTDVLSLTTADALSESGAGEAIICGGTAAVSDQTEGQIESLGLTTRRISGPTRVETAVDAAQDLFGLRSAAGNAYTVVPGYGRSFGFGLAAAPLGNPILLVGTDEPTDCTNTAQPSRATLCYLQTGTGEPAELLVVGSEEFITTAVVDALGEATGGRLIADIPLPEMVQGVTATDAINDDGTRLSVSWAAVDDAEETLAGYTVLVDGTPVTASTPTVGADTLTLVVDGLTPDAEVSITVRAEDTFDRSGPPSAAVLATPVDEVPEMLEDFTGNPGDGEVSLSWDRGPVDTDTYTLTRAVEEEPGPFDNPLFPDPGGCLEYEDLTVVENGDVTSFVDETAENGTPYCYRIVVTDTAGQASPPAEFGAVTPQVGIPTVDVTFPVRTVIPATNPFGDDTVEVDRLYYGEDVLLAYTLSDSDDALTSLVVTHEVSYDGGATYTVIEDGDEVAPDFIDPAAGTAVFAVPSCPYMSADPDTDGCLLDPFAEGEDVEPRYRVTVADPSQLANRDNGGDVEVVATPDVVANLTATPGDARVTVSWDRKDNPTVDSYVVYQRQIAGTTCPTTGYDDGTNPARDVPQPAATEDRVSTLFGDAPGDGVSNGTGTTNPTYCYQVRAIRIEGAAPSPTVLTGPGVIASANPEAGLAGSITVTSPGDSTALDVGQDERINYAISLNQGVTSQSVSFAYCVDYDTEDGMCTGGFVAIAPADLAPMPAPFAAGSRSVVWSVPAGINQGDGQRGALRAVLQTDAGTTGDLVTGIIFR